MIQVKLMQEKAINKETFVADKAIEYNKKMNEIQSKYSNIQKYLEKKLDKSNYSFINKPAFKGGYEAVYQRLIQGKSTAEDYAAIQAKIASELSQKAKLQITKGIKQ